MNLTADESRAVMEEMVNGAVNGARSSANPATPLESTGNTEYNGNKSNPLTSSEVSANEGAGDKADILAQNRAQGKAYEQECFSEFSQNITQAQEQIIVKTQSNIRTRLDAIGFDAEGKIVINEFKSSASAPLTKNQIIAFPEIFDSGATVVGRGKGFFTGGYSISAGTDIKIIRPPK